MRILYDGFIYSIQAAGGINRYFSQIIKRLPQNYIPTLTASHINYVDQPTHPNLALIKYRGFRPGRISCRVERVFFRMFSARNYDVIHPTYYYLLSQQEFKDLRSPLVVTVWDMIHEIFHKEMDPLGNCAAMKRKAIMAAQAIICISHNTRKDLLERYPQIEDRVSVVHLAPGINASHSTDSGPIPARPYYLYVGSREVSYKNFDGLLSAFAKVIASNSDVTLCVVGPPFEKREEKLINDLRLENNIEHYRYADNDHLAKLYQGSIALVYPSFYEGFGIPPLEAMSCGTAVIASNCSSIPEVVGDAALLIDPASQEEMIEALLRLLNDSSERDRLIVKGHERVKAFSWDYTTKQTVAVYDRVSCRKTARDHLLAI